MHGHEVGVALGAREHRVAEGDIGQSGEHAAVAEAARVEVPLLDPQAEGDLLAVAALLERPDQLVERVAARPLYFAEPLGRIGGTIHRLGILASNQTPTAIAGMEKTA